jgi:predicted nucleic acid-binding protein
MRVVLDTNILVSAMITSTGNPAEIVNAWLDGKFTLLTSAEHVDELRATLQKPRVAALIKPHKAGRLVNQIKKLAEDVGALPAVQRSAESHARFSAGHVRSRPGRLSRYRRQERAAGARSTQVNADRFRERFCRDLPVIEERTQMTDNENALVVSPVLHHTPTL